MAKGTTEQRRLIKFSNYSMCVTLPKWVIDELAWQKGDTITLTTDVKQAKITLYKEGQVSTSKAVKKSSFSAKDKPKETSQPVPKLRW